MSEFKLRSGSATPFKLMGSSPVKACAPGSTDPECGDFRVGKQTGKKIKQAIRKTGKKIAGVFKRDPSKKRTSQNIKAEKKNLKSSKGSHQSARNLDEYGPGGSKSGRREPSTVTKAQVTKRKTDLATLASGGKVEGMYSGKDKPLKLKSSPAKQSTIEGDPVGRTREDFGTKETPKIGTAKRRADARTAKRAESMSQSRVDMHKKYGGGLPGGAMGKIAQKLHDQKYNRKSSPQ